MLVATRWILPSGPPVGGRARAGDRARRLPAGARRARVRLVRQRAGHAPVPPGGAGERSRPRAPSRRAGGATSGASSGPRSGRRPSGRHLGNSGAGAGPLPPGGARRDRLRPRSGARLRPARGTDRLRRRLLRPAPRGVASARAAAGRGRVRAPGRAGGARSPGRPPGGPRRHRVADVLRAAFRTLNRPAGGSADGDRSQGQGRDRHRRRPRDRARDRRDARPGRGGDRRDGRAPGPPRRRGRGVGAAALDGAPVPL